MTSNRFRRAAALSALALLLASCAAGVKKDDSAEIDARAVQRWNYLIAHQAGKSYDYLSPGYRQTVARDVYAARMNNRPVHWKSVKFVNKKCDEDRCTVHLAVDYTVNLGAGIGKPVQAFGPLLETWVRVRGQWYFLPSD